MKLITKLIFCAVLLFYAVSGYAQKESANWFFGINAALDFNSGTPTVINNSAIETHEGSASISDADGNLLFYTDGVSVWDRKNRVIGGGLKGNKSSTMSALIVPKPGTNNMYYVFTIDEPGESPGIVNDGIYGVNYYEVDMNLNGGYGALTGVQNHLETYNPNNADELYFKSSEKITAVAHDNETDIWVITHLGQTFYAFLVDASGVNLTPVKSKVGLSVPPRKNESSVNVTAIGYLKVSPNGKKIAIAHSSTALGSPKSGTKNTGKVMLYDFNASTGSVANEVVINDNKLYPYGLEFSPNSKLLYVTAGKYNVADQFEKGYLFQYDINAGNIAGSEKTIHTSNYFAGALQLAIDGKIYRAGYPNGSAGSTLSVISKPNTVGSGCNYQHEKIRLAPGFSRLGLPPFIQSIFKYTFNYNYTCAGAGFDASFNIIPDPAIEDPDYTVSWDFDNGSTSISNIPGTYYNASGTYNVTLTLTINGDVKTIKKPVKIESAPVLNPSYNLITCGVNGSNFGSFDLLNINGNTSMFSGKVVQAYFYENETDALNATKSAAINDWYTNVVQNQEIYARVYADRSDCFELTKVILTTQSPTPVPKYTLETCPFNTKGEGEFDLNTVTPSDLGLPANVTLSFYANASATNQITDMQFVSGDTTIYIKAESSGACYEIGELELQVYKMPLLDYGQRFNVCPSQYPLVIDANILGTFNSSNYLYNWTLNGAPISQNTVQILAHAAGHYEVTVSDPVSGCSMSTSIEIVENPSPVIKDLKIDDLNLEVVLENNEGDFEFAVDGLGSFQSGNFFRDLAPGVHTLFVTDASYCNTIEQQFFVFGFPKVFTPNNDGYQDIWNVKGLDAARFTQPVYMYIYNRYGKLLASFNVLESQGWDGKYNGNILPTDDYWYYIKLPNGDDFRGHFTLKH